MATSRKSSRVPVVSADFKVSGPAGGGRARRVSESRYGQPVVELASERHERRVQAIEFVLRRYVTLTDDWRRRIAEEVLAAVEAGF